MNRKRTYEKLLNEFHEALSHQKESLYGEKSSVWKDQLDKRDSQLPTYERAIRFLSNEDEITSGLTNPESAQDKILKLNFERVASSVGQEQLAKHSNPAKFGAKVWRSPMGVTTSESLRALYQAQLIHEALPNLSQKSSLNILEIGAGYGGCADILIANNIANSYTIVDLPENLFLAAFYLSNSYPEMEIRVHNPNSEAPSLPEPGTLTFVFADFFEQIEGPFDLCINMASFGEMTASTVRAYLNRIACVLLPDGHLISSNSVAFRAEEGFARTVSEYGYGGYRPITLSGSPSIKWPYNHHHLIAMQPLKEHEGNNDYIDMLNCFCTLMRSGLSNDLPEITEIADVTPYALCLGIFLNGASKDTLYQSFESIINLPDTANHYLIGMASFAFDKNDRKAKEHLKNYYLSGKSPAPIAASACILEALGEELPIRPEEHSALTGFTFLYTEHEASLETLRMQARRSVSLQY